MKNNIKIRYEFTQEQYDRQVEFGNITPNGVVFYDELVSWKGCNFYLFKTEGITEKMIAEAKRWLRNERDVVKFHTAYIQ